MLACISRRPARRSYVTRGRTRRTSAPSSCSPITGQEQGRRALAARDFAPGRSVSAGFGLRPVPGREVLHARQAASRQELAAASADPAFAGRVHAGVFWTLQSTVRIPAPARAASNAAVKFDPRPRIMNLWREVVACGWGARGGGRDAADDATGLCSTCPRRDVRGRFLTGWVRSSRESPGPSVSALGRSGVRRGGGRGRIWGPLWWSRDRDISGGGAVSGGEGPAPQRGGRRGAGRARAREHPAVRGIESAPGGVGLLCVGRGDLSRVRAGETGSCCRPGGRPMRGGEEAAGRGG